MVTNAFRIKRTRDGTFGTSHVFLSNAIRLGRVKHTYFEVYLAHNFCCSKHIMSLRLNFPTIVNLYQIRKRGNNVYPCKNTKFNIKRVQGYLFGGLNINISDFVGVYW